MYSRWLKFCLFQYEGEEFISLPKDDAENLLVLITRNPKDFKPYHQREKISNLYKFNGIVKNGRFSISLDTAAPVFFMPKLTGEFLVDSEGTWLQLKASLFRSTIISSLISVAFMLIVCAVLFISKQLTYCSVLFLFYLLGYIVGVLDFKVNVLKTVGKLKKELTFS